MLNSSSNMRHKRRFFDFLQERRLIGFKRGIALGMLSVSMVLGFWLTHSHGKESVLSARPARVDQGHRSGNQLAGAASPYLREAARQPVHWRPWSQAAFEEAQQQDKPILLDIGAVWCHWCHVMDVESYEDEAIAHLINKHFVAIKVDMDERPDIDHRYQEAVQALTGQGGWPLTAFLTPEGQVFFGGTYFPPDTHGGRVGLKVLLPQLAEVYVTQKAQIMAGAKELSKGLTQFAVDFIQKENISETLLQEISSTMAQQFDPVNGGFGTGVKFPAGSAIELALVRHFTNHDPKMLKLVTKTLDAMAHGGVYDHIGGGFFRYSTDPQWRIPHFEKMSYDNAELLTNYLHAYQATGKALYRETAQGIMGYLNRVLSDRASGGFYAHQDADMTREDDGDYYTWTVEEVRQVLPKDEAAVMLRFYDIQPHGEMRENPAKNVPVIATTPEILAQELALPLERVESLIQQGTSHLFQARMNRQAPLVDQTIYIDRNGLLISAYLEAFQALGDEEAKAFALKTLDLLLHKAYREGKGMFHAYFEGHVRISGLLNDQVHMAKAALAAFEVTGELRYLHVVKDLMDYVIANFWDPKAGGFFDRYPQGNALAALTRPHKAIIDNPSASPNGVVALVLDRLASVTNQKSYKHKALETLEAFAGSVKGNGYMVASYAMAVHYHLTHSAQAVIIGKKHDHDTQVLWNAVLRTYRPGKLVAVYDPSELSMESLPPSVAGAVKVFGVQGEPKVYVCAGVTCAPPTGNPDEVAALVKTYGLRKPSPS